MSLSTYSLLTFFVKNNMKIHTFQSIVVNNCSQSVEKTYNETADKFVFLLKHKIVLEGTEALSTFINQTREIS